MRTRFLASILLVILVAAACGDGAQDDFADTTEAATTQPAAATTTEAPPATTTQAPATTTKAATTTTTTEALDRPTGQTDSGRFDDVLNVWNIGGTTNPAGIYAPDARVIDNETVAARGIGEIEEAAATSRGAGNFSERIAAPTIVYETGAGDAYAIAPVASYQSKESLGTLEIVVLEWAGDTIATHWRLHVPSAAQGDYDVEDDTGVVALTARMTQAFTTGDAAIAQEVYGAGVRVYWFGEKTPEGLDEILASIVEAHSIGNRYEDITTPTLVIEATSLQKHAVSVLNVTGIAHPNGSLVIAVSEVEGDKIIAWAPFFLENLPPGLSGSDS